MQTALETAPGRLTPPSREGRRGGDPRLGRGVITMTLVIGKEKPPLPLRTAGVGIKVSRPKRVKASRGKRNRWRNASPERFLPPPPPFERRPADLLSRSWNKISVNRLDSAKIPPSSGSTGTVFPRDVFRLSLWTITTEPADRISLILKYCPLGNVTRSRKFPSAGISSNALL